MRSDDGILGKKVWGRFPNVLLVIISLLLGFLCVETLYRGYLYYSYIIAPQYLVTTTDVRRMGNDATEAGSVYGPFQPYQPITFTTYDLDNNMVQRLTVPVNNLGWISQYDYARQKQQGEYRIAVIGDSMTASQNNEIPWPDVVQRRLNADTELLKMLAIEKMTVLNLGVAGASMQYMAFPLAFVARRFSPDMTVVNFIYEDLARRHEDASEKRRAEPVRPPRDDAPPPVIIPPHMTVEGVEIPFHYCLSGTMEQSNPTCKLSPIWYVPGSIQLDKQALLHIKRKAAREMLSHQLVTSLKPFAVMAVLGRPTIPSPPKPIYVKKLLPDGLKSSWKKAVHAVARGRDTEDMEISLRALKFIGTLHKEMLVLHNPVYWYMTGERPTPTLEKFIGMAEGANIKVVRMEQYMPYEKGEEEWRHWYNLP